MERAEQTFPVLTPAQIDRVAALGHRTRAPAGEILYEAGEQNTRFFVVVSGAVEVVQPVGGIEKLIVVHGPGQFTGEINMLSARRSLVRGRTTEESELVVLDREALRQLVQRDPELSEILMRAFILRRVALLDTGNQDLVLVGSRHSADTMRIRSS
jgi:thioredoxin reductase (NADPH)